MAVYLLEDYVVKILDFSFWNEGIGIKKRSFSLYLLEVILIDIESNVFNFGVVMFEIIIGRMFYLEDMNCFLVDWVLEYLDRDYIF